MVNYDLIDNKYKDFLLDIKQYFEQNDQTIHKARNELKIIPYEGNEFVVKSFKKPNIIRRIVYTFFRSSKAKKSYEYSIKIKPFTPKPIGYIEFYESALLGQSYFVAEKFDYDFTIREPLLDGKFPDREKIFEAFALFTYELHQNQILHKDYSPGNILIKKEGQSYLFKVVDINRMEFKELSTNERLANFDKLWAKDEDLSVMIKTYAKKLHIDENEAIQKALHYSHALKKRKNFKKRLKGIPVND